MKRWERIIRNNFNHLEKDTLEAVIGVFEVGLQNGHVLSLDKDYILSFWMVFADMQICQKGLV